MRATLSQDEKTIFQGSLLSLFNGDYRAALYEMQVTGSLAWLQGLFIQG